MERGLYSRPNEGQLARHTTPQIASPFRQGASKSLDGETSDLCRHARPPPERVLPPNFYVGDQDKNCGKIQRTHVRIRFQDGKPTVIEPFVSGFLLDQGDGRWARFARPFGLVVARDGSMLMGDEQNGIIYRISHVP